MKDKLGRDVIGVTHKDCFNLEELHEKLMNYGGKYADTKEKIGNSYQNIISHMDLVWHHENGPDGCSKCTKYQEILFKAFREIHELSGRDLSQDFCSYNKLNKENTNVTQ